METNGISISLQKTRAQELLSNIAQSSCQELYAFIFLDWVGMQGTLTCSSSSFSFLMPSLCVRSSYLRTLTRMASLCWLLAESLRSSPCGLLEYPPNMAAGFCQSKWLKAAQGRRCNVCYSPASEVTFHYLHDIPLCTQVSTQCGRGLHQCVTVRSRIMVGPSWRPAEVTKLVNGKAQRGNWSS